MMGAIGGGVTDGMVEARRMQADEDNRQWMAEQRKREKTQQDEADKLQQDMRAATSERTVSTMQGPTPDGEALSGYAVGDQAVGTREEADAVAARENAVPRRMDRAAQVMANAGKLDQAERYRAFAKQAREEGVGELVSAIQASSPGLDKVRAAQGGMVDMEIPADALKGFDGVGQWRIPQGTKVQAYVSKNAYGADVLDHRVIRPDGQVMVASLHDASRLLGATAAERAQAQERQDATAYAVGKDTRDFKLREKAQEETGAHYKAMARAASARGQSAPERPSGPAWGDLQDGFKAISSFVAGDYKAAMDAEPDQAARAAIARKRDDEIVMAQRVHTGAAMAGVLMTPEQSVAAGRTGQVVQAQVPRRDGSGTVTMQGINVNGRFIPLADPPGFGQQTEAKPAQAGKAGQAPAKPASQEPPVQRVKQTPVVEFAKPAPGQAKARAAAEQAQSDLPALRQAVKDAAAAMEAAKSKGGPMAAQRARDAWANAKTALADAESRAR